MCLFLDDPQFLASYRNGDRDTLEQVYRTHVKEVDALVRWGFCLTKGRVVSVPGVREPAVQEDLVQETFVRAFSPSARNSYDGKNPFRPYLLRIAKNLMIDRLRKQNRQVMESILEPLEEAASSSSWTDLDPVAQQPDAEEEARQHKRILATQLFVAQLSEPERTFHSLRYQHGLAQRAIATNMGITRRKVRTLENRLRRGLYKHLKSNGLWN